MSSTADVTVVIPTHDRWDLLSTFALPSALSQEDVDVEVVIVDDGSTDETAARLAGIRDDRVRVVRHDVACGVAQARNAGIRQSRADWIAFLDDDDIWAPNKLRLQLDAAATQNAGFVYGGAAAIADDRSWLYSRQPPDPATLAETLLSRNVLWGGSSNVVVRSDIARQLGGFDERLFQLCDWDFWIRLACHGEAAVCQEVVVACLKHPRSMLLTTGDDIYAEFLYIREKHREVTKAVGVDFDRAVFARWVALGHQRAGRRFRAAWVLFSDALANRDPLNLLRATTPFMGPRVVARMRSLLRRDEADDRVLDPAAQPEWLERYR